MKIVLTQAEMQQAAFVGCYRNAENIKKGRRARYGANNKRNGWQYAIEGALGEMAAAKACGVFWSGAHDFGAEDILGADVRTSSFPDVFPMHDKDNDDRKFIGVFGAEGTYDVEGWLWGGECKRKEWFSDRFRNGRPAYWVPRDKLRPLSSIDCADEWPMDCVIFG